MNDYPAPENIPPVSQQDKPQTKRWQFFLIIVLVTASLVTAGFILWKYFFTNEDLNPPVPAVIPTQKPAPTVVGNPDPTANWKTFESKNPDFTLKYPGNEFKVSTESAKYLAEFIYNRTIKGISTKNPITVSKISIPASSDFETVLLKNVTLEASGEHPKSFAEFKKVSLGNNDYYYIQTGRFEGQLELSYFLPQQDYILEFSLSSYIGSDWTNPAFDTGNEKYHVILKQMLSTLNVKIETTIIETGNWKTYKNDVYKIEFKYPREWIINKENNPDLEKGDALEVEWKTNNSMTFSMEGNPRPIDIVKGHIMGDIKSIGNTEFYYSSLGDRNGLSSWLYYTGEKNTITPTFKFGYLLGNKDQSQKIINQILSTFQFTK